MDFDEYLKLQERSFVQYYRCRPTSCLDRENMDIEDGNYVIMPPSAFDRLDSLEVEFPMQFQIQNPSTERASHCGVLEFVAEEGFIYIPAWLMAHLGLEENDLVLVQQKALPKATFVKLQAHSKEFLGVRDPKELLEHNFRKYACLTAGDTITVREGDRRYYLDVLEAQPGGAVGVIDTDCSVDFVPPLDYVEPARFTGVAARMDGKPVEQPAAPASAAATAGVKPRRGLRFGGIGQGKEDGAGAGKQKEQRFTGTAYSLQ